jgi:hypothetical protein
MADVIRSDDWRNWSIEGWKRRKNCEKTRSSTSQILEVVITT